MKKDVCTKIMKYAPYILILAIVCIFSYDLVFQPNSFFQQYSFFHNTGASVAIHQNINDNLEYPIWLPNLMSGEPNGNVGSMLSNPPLIVLNFFFDPILAFNINCIMHMLLLLLGTFYLSKYVLKRTDAAMIATAAIGTTRMVVYSGHFAWFLYGIAYIPWVFLFMIKAFEEDSYIRNTLIFSALLALQFLAGGVVHMYYSGFLYALYFIYQFIFIFKIRKGGISIKKNRLKRLVIIGALCVIVFLGLAACRLLYFMDSMQYASNRVHGMPLNEILSGRVNTLDVFIDKMLISNQTRYGNLNIIANILMVMGAVYGFRQRKKWPIFLTVSYLFFFILVTGYVVKLFLPIPGFDKIRLIDRFSIMNIITGGLLAGYGFIYLKDTLLKKKAIIKKWAFTGVLLIILIMSLAVTFDQLQLWTEKAESKHIVYDAEYAKTLKEDKGIYRIHFNEVRGVDGHNSNMELFWFDLESTYGIFGTQWDSRYFNEFMAPALSYKDKLFGLLNVKYVISHLDENITGFEQHDTFNVSRNIIVKGKYPQFSTGYIYKNNNFLPRAFFVDNSILVVGKGDYVKSLTYNLLLNDNFDPKKTVLVLYEDMKIGQIPQDELKMFDAIVLLAESIGDSFDMNTLKNYVEAGGRTFPDVNSDDLRLNLTEVEVYLGAIESGYEPLEITTFFTEDPNTIEIETAGKDGFVFVSEKMPLYEGWTAVSNNGEKNIMKGNAIFAAVKVDEDDKYLRFDFAPSKYRLGNRITIFTLLALIVIPILYYRYKKERREG